MKKIIIYTISLSIILAGICFPIDGRIANAKKMHKKMHGETLLDSISDMELKTNCQCCFKPLKKAIIPKKKAVFLPKLRIYAKKTVILHIGSNETNKYFGNSVFLKRPLISENFVFFLPTIRKLE